MVEPVIVPADVQRLVIAARIVAYEEPVVTPEALTELDQAAEAFASRVPWDDEPCRTALQNDRGEG